MKKMLRQAAVVLTAAITIGSCGIVRAETEINSVQTLKVNSDPVNTQVTDETLTVDLSSEPSMLWGASCGKLETEDVLISYALFDTLVSNDPYTGEVVPNLAESWEWVDDTHCKFMLRDDVTMSDGTPLTAEDVAYTANVWREKSANNDTGMYIDGAEVNDEHTVTLSFTTTAPDIIVMLGWSQFGIVSEDEVNALGGLDACQMNPALGCGKYRFKEWNSGDSIVLERNDNYWNPDYKGYFKNIVFHFVQDPAARVMSIQSGDADLAYEVPAAQAVTLLADPSLKTYFVTSGNIEHLWYNMGENAGPTKDLKVRQAIDKALDFDAIAQVGSAGTQEPVQGYAGEISKYYSETYSKDERKVDVEGAKELLKEAGYENGMELSILGLQAYQNVSTVIQANLAAVGIHLTINIVDTAKFVEDAFAGNYDLISVPETLVTRCPNVFPFLRKENIYGKGVVIGGPKWTTDELDNDITRFVQAKDDEAATEDLKKIEKIIKDNQVCSDLYQSVNPQVTSAELKGLTSPDRGYIDFTTLYK